METAQENRTIENSTLSEQNNKDTETKETAKEEETNKIEPVRGKRLFVKGISGNPKGRPKKKPFSIREDLINSLRRIRSKNKKLYNEIVDSYWRDPKMRQFLLEIVDGKARQSMDIGSIKDNPVKMVVISKMIDDPQTDTKQLQEPERA
jgi:hypothetical protein